MVGSDDPILSVWVTYFQGRTASFREGIHHGLSLCSWFFMILPQKCSSAQRRGRRTGCTSLTQTSLVGKSGEKTSVDETFMKHDGFSKYQINNIYSMSVCLQYKYPINIIFYDGLVQAVLLCQYCKWFTLRNTFFGASKSTLVRSYKQPFP